ncbi:MAG TPA: GntR family transcriptional regulator [Stellaceae bacterium]|nr:GntR family transcriptional regulator [Stellaceae bacterium]
MASSAPAAPLVSLAAAPGGRAEWLARLLRERLWGGAYRPHQWIRETTLRAEFGLSNGPVREALQMLVAEGLLERVPYCGIRVVALDDQEIVALFQLRLALLEIAAELAALRRDADALAAAPSVLAQVRQNAGAEPRPAPGHLMGWLVEASGNRELAHAWERLAGKSRMYLYESVRRAHDPRPMMRDAEALVAAVVAGQPAKARQAVRLLTEHQIKDLGLALLPTRRKTPESKK